MKGVIVDDADLQYRYIPREILNEAFASGDIEFKNFSSFGSTIVKGFKTIKRVIEGGEAKPDAVILEFGGNDCDFDWKAVAEQPELEHSPKTKLEDFIKIYEEILAYFRARSIQTIVMNLPPVDGERYLDFLVAKGLEREELLRFIKSSDQISRFQELYSLSIERLAFTHDLYLFDCRSAFLTINDSRSSIGKDGIHPSLEGYKMIARSLKNFLKPYKQLCLV